MPSKTEKGKAPAAAGDSPTISPAIWKELAFRSPDLPRAGSSVYYFCNGHAEQCSTFPPGLYTAFSFSCFLAAVNLHADPITDQLFATFTLTTESSSPETATAGGSGVGAGCLSSVVITLTKSETNYQSKSFLNLPENARRVFGQLVTGDDVEVYDLNNGRWRFRYFYGGNPPRHLLTVGWSHFALSKMLVAGDEVVFTRDDDGIIIVGCRRCGDDDGVVNGVIRRTPTRFGTKLRKKREGVDMVFKALRWAEEDGEGVVEGRYYPDSKLPVYVVEKEVVDNALKVQWAQGMRVGKRWETVNGLIFWLYGTVNSLSPDSTDTPWRMLEVIWDETNLKTNENPWEVKPIPQDITSKPDEKIENPPTSTDSKIENPPTSTDIIE